MSRALCAKCARELPPIRAKGIGLLLCLEVAFWLLVVAFILPILWLKVLSAVLATGFFALAISLNKLAEPGPCIECGSGVHRG